MREVLRILVLEDDEKRIKIFQRLAISATVHFVTNPEQAKAYLSEYEYDRIYLDHDLLPHHYGNKRPPDNETGYAVAEFLSRRPELSRDADIVLHSLSESGVDRMWRKLRETRRRVVKINFLKIKELIENDEKRKQNDRLRRFF